jgi:Xaa-Pro aminopeptidase
MIKQKEYVARRKELMSMMHSNSIAIISSAPEKVRSRDTHYPYKQNVNLTYLCGFPEPEAVLVLIPGRQQGEMIVFLSREGSTQRDLGWLSRGSSGCNCQFWSR